MKKTIVFFLGAGASRPFGIPLTNEILPKILSSIEKRDLFVEIKDYKNRPYGDYSEGKRREMENDLQKFLYHLLPGLEQKFRTNKGELPLITEILSLVDHLAVNGNRPFGGALFKDGKELSYYRYLLDRAIYEVLADDEDRSFSEEEYLNDFVSYISKLIHDKWQVTIITTNYDTMVEMRIYEEIYKPDTIGYHIDFGFSWRDVSTGAIHQPEIRKLQLRIYKLHGSLNWLKCDLCDHVYINPWGNLIHQSFRKKVDYDNSCHCATGPLRSLIVAPSLERDVRDANLLHVWKSSVQALREAEKLVIIGYSLPQEDLAIKSLLMRGKNSRVKKFAKKDFIVVQFGNKSLPAYQLLFGEDNFVFLEKGLEEYLTRYN